MEKKQEATEYQVLTKRKSAPGPEGSGALFLPGLSYIQKDLSLILPVHQRQQGRL